MAERGKTEISPQKRSLKLAPLLGDWTTYKPLRSQVKKVKTGLYGFDRLSEDEFKKAHRLHYNFALKLCDSLKTRVRSSCELYSVDAQQNTYANFVKSFPMPIYQAKFTSDNHHDEVFISFDMQLIDSLINSALGTKETNKLIQPPTEAEELILDTIFAYHLFSFYEIFDIVMEGQKFEKVGSPELTVDSSINQQATFVYFTIEIQVNDTVGRIIIGYRGDFIKSLIKNLATKEKPSALPFIRLHPQIFNSVSTPIIVTLGKTTLTMNEIKGLEIGDVVSFDQSIDNAIPIVLSDGHTIMGQPGKNEGKFAVKIVGVEKEKTMKIAPPTIKKEPELLDEEKENTEGSGENEEQPEELEEKTETEETTPEEFSESEYSDEDLEGLLDEGEETSEGSDESLEEGDEEETTEEIEEEQEEEEQSET